MDQDKKMNEVFFYGSQSLYDQVTSLMQEVVELRGRDE